MARLSVIIPVYNVEKYLCKCLDSVLNQTFSDIEIICVNDASTDTSLQILNEYRHKDSRITIINNEKNLGLGLTRNHGLQYASGEYVHFLDSDDWLENSAYEKLFKVIENFNKPQIIHFEYQFCSNIDCAKKRRDYPYYKNNLFNKVLNIEQERDIIDIWDRHAWNKIFSRKFLAENKILFNDYRCYEDMEFSIKTIISAKSIYFIKDILLNYRYNNPNSLIAKYYMHNDIAYASYLTAVKLSENLENETRQKLLSAEFSNVYIILLSAYKDKKINYKEFRYWLNKFDYNIFDKNILKKGAFFHAFEVLNKPEFIFKLKSRFRFIIKNSFPEFYSLLIALKNYILRIK